MKNQQVEAELQVKQLKDALRQAYPKNEGKVQQVLRNIVDNPSSYAAEISKAQSKINGRGAVAVNTTPIQRATNTVNRFFQPISATLKSIASGSFLRKSQKEGDGFVNDSKPLLSDSYKPEATTTDAELLNLFMPIDDQSVENKQGLPVIAVGIPVSIEVGVPLTYDVETGLSKNNFTEPKVNSSNEKQNASKETTSELLKGLVFPKVPSNALPIPKPRASASSSLNSTKKQKEKKRGPVLA
ncbi:hypothetical protein [Ascidiimonas sp. W6]|uniref:hypothetical protein n=1 Tax=Ascidiimonas meishanensis TaxID=3128903 RepID=UPI0030ECF2C0